MNILLATDDNFVQHCAVTMMSIMHNNKAVTFYLFTEGLKESNRTLLLEMVKEKGAELIICKIESDLVESFPMPKAGGTHISIATYYRLFVAKILPATVDKILYVDCDIVVRSSLDDLFKMDMTGKAIAAVFQNEEFAHYFNVYKRLSIPEEFGYFNAGVLLINIDYWRNNKITEQLYDFIAKYPDVIVSHDQDVLNAVLYSETLALNPTWNYLPSFMDGQKHQYPARTNVFKNPSNPSVIHYVSVPKPWVSGCNNKYKNEYFRYLDMTPYTGWRPKFSLINNWKYIVKPGIFSIIRRILK